MSQADSESHTTVRVIAPRSDGNIHRIIIEMVNLHDSLSQHWVGQGCHWPSPLGTKVDLTNSSHCPAIPRWRWALAALEYAWGWIAVCFLVEWSIQYLAFINRCEVCKCIGMGRRRHSCGTRGWSGFYIVYEHRTFCTNLRLGFMWCKAAQRCYCFQ